MRGVQPIFFLLTVVVLAVGLGGHVSPDSAAACTNYENYLHWIATMDTVEDPIDMAIQGSYAYVLSSGPSGGWLKIIDISDPGNPFEVGSLGISGYRIAVSGTRAAIASGSSIYGVDITNPAAPSFCGSQVTLNGISGIYIEGTTIIIAQTTGTYTNHQLMRMTYCGGSNWEMYDRDQPFNPAAMAVQGDFAYVAGGSHGLPYDRGLFVVDISDFYLPPVGQYVDNSLDPVDVAVSDNLAFLACQTSGLLIFDISDPISPLYRSTFNPGLCADAVTAAGDYCYLSCADEGVTYIVDVSDPLNPVEVGGITPFGRCTDVLIEGSHLYMSIEDGGVDIVAAASPGGLDPIGSFNTDGVAEDVAYSADFPNLLFVADGDNGVQVIDFSDPFNPVLHGSMDTPGYASEIAVAGTYAYVADADSLQIIDVAAPDVPVRAGAIETPGTAVDIEVAGDFAYLADTSAGLRIFNIATPSAPLARGFNDTVSSANAVTVVGQLAYVADGIKGLKVLDVSDPDNPWIIDGVKAAGLDEAMEVAVAGNLAYVADADSGLYVVDVSVPQSLTVLGSLQTNDAVRDLVVTGDHAYLANSEQGLQLVDVEDAVSPLFIGSANVPSVSRGVAVNADFAFVAADTAGLQVCRGQCGAYERVTADFLPDTTAAFLPATIDFQDLSLGYILNREWDFGDASGGSTEVSPTYTFNDHGEYTVQLKVNGLASSDSLTTVIYALSEPPLIMDVTDVPSDQGGFVYVNFARSGYDDTAPSKTEGDKSTEFYTIQRQDAGVWVTVATSGAYGDLYYSVLANTQGDGSASWTTPFRVIAHMDDGIWIGPEISGFSEDNIAPGAPTNVTWQSAGVLAWDASPASDFAYYKVLAGPSMVFEESSLVGTSIVPNMDLTGIIDNWVFVVTVDDADLESASSSPVGVSDVPQAVTRVQLHSAVPNPFNPRTTIGYATPRKGHVRLSVFDLSGRLVKVLVDEAVASGQHQVIWYGKDRSGRQVPSGIYISRLEADGQVLTDRMALIR